MPYVVFNHGKPYLSMKNLNKVFTDEYQVHIM